MTNKININWKKVAANTLQALLIAVFNVASILWFILNCLEIKLDLELSNLKNESVSFWDIMTNKVLYEMIVGDRSWLPEYHWYNKFLIIFFMFVGVAISYLYLKFLYQRHRDNVNREKQKEIDDERAEKLADKIIKGVGK